MSQVSLSLRRRSAGVDRQFFGGETTAAAVLFVVLAAVPPMLGGYPTYILPQYMLFGMLAMSLSLLWGFAGIVSFGQAAFFAIGAYGMGLTMQLDLGFNAAYAGILIAVLGAALLAAITGYFLFSAGVRATYFVLVTLALSISAEQVAVSQSEITGGWNGLYVDRMTLTFGPLGTIGLSDDAPVFYFILVLVACTYLLLRRLTTSKLGKVLVGIRENEDRLTALGYDVALYKTLAFALSGAAAGLAGALYATHASFVSPSLGGVLFSTQVVVWVAIGGRASLLGALTGGIVVSSLTNYLSAIIPDYWQLALGFIFIVVIVFFKRGLAGLTESAFESLTRRRTAR
ncbi:MAG: branched-chain amino acid ABC transporter permease [Pseudomonadota bacterium]